MKNNVRTNQEKKTTGRTRLAAKIRALPGANVRTRFRTKAKRPVRAALAAAAVCGLLGSGIGVGFFHSDIKTGGRFFFAREKAEQTECGSGVIQTAAVPGEEDVVIRQGDAASAKTAVTCNVDWGEDVLPDILDILSEREIKITFFVSGKWAEKNPALFRRMYVAGHEIQSHGYSHKLCSQIATEQTKDEIEKTEAAFTELIGQKPTVFAPPSGDYNAETVELCRQLGYRLSLWSADTIDWRPGSTADIICGRVLKKDLHGGIILMHPKPETAKALPRLLEEIEAQGLSVVPLCELGVY